MPAFGKREIEQSRQRLSRLRERAGPEGDVPGTPLGEALDALRQTLDELQATREELASTREELAQVRIATEENARRYRDFFSTAPDGLVVTDEQGVILDSNPAAEQRLGRPGRDLRGRSLLSLVVPSDRDAFLECLTALRSERGRPDHRLLRFGADPGFYASVGAVPERRDGSLEIRWTMRDLSELRERDAFRDEIERHLDSIIWLSQLQPNKLLLASHSYETVWGQPLAAMYEDPRAWIEPVHPEDRPRVEESLQQLVRGEAIDLEFRILRPDGEVRWIHNRGIPFRDARGRLDRAAGIAEDVTEKKRVGEALEQVERHRRAAARAAERAEARERRALAEDLHDAVSQTLALARTKLAALYDVADESERLATLRDLEALIVEADERTRTLTFRLSPPVLHDLGLAAAADWLAEDLERRFALKLEITDQCLPEPLGFEIREALFRSLRELLVNVARHAGTGHARVLLGSEHGGPSIRVEDGGIGFDMGRLSTGFGLVSIRERIEALGGVMEIDSAPGRGTSVRLWVPAQRSG